MSLDWFDLAKAVLCVFAFAVMVAVVIGGAIELAGKASNFAVSVMVAIITGVVGMPTAIILFVKLMQKLFHSYTP